MFYNSYSFTLVLVYSNHTAPRFPQRQRRWLPRSPRLGRRSLAAIKASQAVQQAAYLLTAFKRRYQCGWDTTPSKRFPERGASPREPRCRDTQQCRQAKRANAIFCRWMNIDVLSGKNAAGWSDAKLHFSICCTSRFVRTWRWVKNQANTALCTLGW